jgi:hypothetical protein
LNLTPASEARFRKKPLGIRRIGTTRTTPTIVGTTMGKVRLLEPIYMELSQVTVSPEGAIPASIPRLQDMYDRWCSGLLIGCSGMGELYMRRNMAFVNWKNCVRDIPL